MKKLVILFTLLALICFSLYSCGGQEDDTILVDTQAETTEIETTETETEAEIDYDKYDKDGKWTPYL